MRAKRNKPQADTLQFNLSQKQINEIITKIASQEEGFVELIKLAFEAFMKSERAEHNLKNNDVSNGFRPRKWRIGRYVIELKIPRSRNTNFYPKLLLVLQDQQQKQLELASLLYSEGLSIGQISRILKDYFGHHYGISTIERLLSQTKEQINLWLKRPLERHYPVIYIDAIFMPVRREQKVSNEAFLTVLALKEDLRREVIGIYNFVTESSQNWSVVFEDLRNRGVERVDLVVSDALVGIENAVSKYFSNADHQLCTTHLKRNILNRVKNEDKEQIKRELKEVFSTDKDNDSQLKGVERFKEFANRWQKKYRFLKNLTESSRIALYFTYLNYNKSIRNMIYTTNWIERLNREYKRALKYRGPFPDPESVINVMVLTAMNIKRFDFKLSIFKDEEKFFASQ